MNEKCICNLYGHPLKDSKAREEINILKEGTKYQLIETITVEEETPRITRTQEPNGTEYKIKRLLLKFVNESGVTSSNAVGLYTYGKNVQTGTTYNPIKTDVAIPSKKADVKYCWIEIYLRNGVWCLDAMFWAKYKGEGAVERPYSWQPTSTSVFEAQVPFLTRVFIDNVPVGTTMEIWGVK